MNFIRDFSRGVRAYGKATKLLFSPRLRWFMLFPVVAIILLFLAGNFVTGYLGDGLSDVVEAKVMTWIQGVSWLSWLSETAGVIVKVFVRILYYVLFISFGGYAVMVVMSPIHSWLSERTEGIVSGTEYPFSPRQLVWEIGRGIVIALRCAVFQLLMTLALFVCSFIPLAGLVTPVLTFGVSAYFYGFAFVDYAVERKRFRVKDSMRYMQRNAGMVMGIGAVFTLSLMIPLASIVACSFVSLLSVVAGTVAVSEQMEAGDEKNVKF